MPFQSEKQRRFLWAEHPDIAKRWAHEYPTKKKLPMYAHDKKPESSEESKEASINISEFVNRYVNNRSISNINTVQNIITKTDKTADSKQEKVTIQHSSKPVYAGEERDKGQITADIPNGQNINESDNNSAPKPQNAINQLLTKLSAVLSPHIEQTIENMKAEREGRVAVRIPRNRGIKRYPHASPTIPLPMGMTQTQPQQPQQPQQHLKPVGGGSHPQFNPINAFGAISMSGEINGNAAFGAKNSPDSSKIAAVIKRANEPIDFDKWHGKAFKIVSTPEGKASRNGQPIANTPGQVSIVTPENGDAWNWPDAPAETVNNFKKNWGSIQGGIAGYKMDQIRRGMQKQPTAPQPPEPNVPQPPKPPAPPVNTGAMTSQPISVKQATRSEALTKLMDLNLTDPVDVNYYNEEFEEEMAGQKAGSCQLKPKEKAADMVKYSLEDTLKLARCWAGYEPVPGKAPYSEDSCRPVGSGKKKKKENKKSEKKADSPAWQKSEGKNEAGGLNEKGRKSYEREHGGNLKAPVTEKNPTGKAKARRHSFCSRMCGMKRVNTGAGTAKDPDSRINKSLRKWNCKCSSVQAFGEKCANWGLVTKALQAGGRAAAGAARTGAKVVRRPPPPLPVPFSMTAAARAVNNAKIDSLATKYLGQIGSQTDEAIQALHGGFQNATGRGADAARYVANHTHNSLNAIADATNRAGLNLENFNDASRFFGQQGNKIKELISNAVGAQRMAAGTLKVPRPKPVGFSDVTGADWQAFSNSLDDHDAIRRTLGMQ